MSRGKHMSTLHKATTLLVLTFLATCLLAQTDTGRLVGTVTDTSGAVVSNATVTGTNAGTARTVTVQTNNPGQYAVNALPPGAYQLEVKQASFKTATANFSLDVSQVKEINLKLEPGSATTTIDVTTAGPLVDTATSSTGEVIQGRQVTELP